MYRKIISVMSVALVVFLCFQFPVFAVTGGGKTIVSNSYSYNNGDVTVYVRVNGQAAEELYEGQHYYPHNFTVTLANNTNEFQVADANNFSVDLYSGSANAFASNQNSWGAEVTSYSDNMTVPRITMYPSGDLAGHVLVAFNDSDLLVLNPNETRTYDFSINFIQTENVNYTPLNGNFRYSYFTYTGTVGFYARPSSFSSNTIGDFISNNSYPNSVIAYCQALLNQGDIEQNTLNDILTYLSSAYSFMADHYHNYSSQVIGQQSYTMFSTSNIVATYDVTPFRPHYINADIESLGISDNNQYLFDYILDMPVYYSVSFRNSSDNTYSMDRNYYSIPKLSLVPNGSFSVVGTSLDVLNTTGIYPYSVWNDSVNIRFDENYTAYNALFPGRSNYHLEYIVHYYIGLSGININDLTISTSNFNYNNPQSFYVPTFTQRTPNIFQSIPRNFADIRDRIQAILDSYNANAPAAQDVTDASEDTQDVVSDQHDIESGYFEDTQTYITDTGIQNFQFDPAITGGLGGVKDDFTAVWTSCGTLAQYWIASLTIGLALSIIRHRRMFSK